MRFLAIILHVKPLFVEKKRLNLTDSGRAVQVMVKVDPEETFSPPSGEVMVIFDGGSLSVKEAATLTFELIVILHVAVVPEHPPDQPAKEEPLSGFATRLTTVPGENAEPDGLLVTVPEPEPVFFMVRVYLVGFAVKLADMVWFAVTLLKV